MTSAIAVAAGLFLGIGAYAQQSAAENARQIGQQGQAALQQGQQELQQLLQQGNLNPDKLFLIAAAMDSQFEIQLSQQAQQKAQSQQVKDVAQRIVQDHQQMMQPLQQVAQKQGISQLPMTVSPLQQQEIQAVSQLQGDQFDKAYLSAMKAGHAKDLSKFSDESKIAQSEDVKQFASQQLPTLQQHAQQIMQQAVAMGLSGGMGEAMTAGSRMTPGENSGSNSSGGNSSGGVSNNAAGNNSSGSSNLNK